MCPSYALLSLPTSLIGRSSDGVIRSPHPACVEVSFNVDRMMFIDRTLDG